MYRMVMSALSDCGLGAVLVNKDGLILSINDAGDDLLGGSGDLRGTLLSQSAPFLEETEGEARYGNPAFGVYLAVCPSPRVSVPEGTRLLVFRNATDTLKSCLLEDAIRHVNEAITIYDRDARMLLINDAAEKLESHLSEDILGKQGSLLFRPAKDSVLAIPLVLKKKQPILNLRQEFVTHTGKEVQVVSNSYPVNVAGELAGAVCMQENLSSLDALHRKIAELQSIIRGSENNPKSKNESAFTARYHFSDILYTGAPIQKTIEKCKMIAQSSSSVMIYGETGTGKELFAQSIHNASRRSSCPFIAINCAAIPESLLEGILFGTEKGAYTGSVQREGLLEQAHTGTLLLDEINSMDIQLQGKLLRFLQEGTIRRVGGRENIRVDARIISNINIPPMQAIEENLLRRDLYYRLGVVNLKIPPLRDRKEDIPILVKSFLTLSNQTVGKNISGISRESLDVMYAYDWPGNVRELQHAVEYTVNILPFDHEEITPDYLPDHILDAVHYQAADSFVPRESSNVLREAAQNAERRLLLQVLLEQNKNISRTARELGITRQNLQHHMKTLGIDLNELPF